MNQQEEVISTYTLNEAIDDGTLVPLFQNRWNQLTGGRPIVATSNVLNDFSLGAMQEIWNEFVAKGRKRRPTSAPFVTQMNNKTIWVVDDGYAVTILFPEDY